MLAVLSVMIAIATQIGWGTFPVFLRYLQSVSKVPSLSLIGFANLLMFILVGSVVVRQLLLEEDHGKAIDGPVPPEVFAGLPMPREAWDG